MAVVIETSLGDITVDLFTEERPRTCFNFLKLCKTKYYNYCLVTEIKKDYTVRAGDPLNNGGDSIYVHELGVLGRLFEAEQEPRIKHSRKGCISMINNGNGKHGSQFFITLEKNLDYLDQQRHTVFGIVTEGADVLDTINEQIVDHDGMPFQDICISHTVILDDPFPDPPYLDELLGGIKSPEIPDRLINSNRIGIYETFNDDEGKTQEQLHEEMEQKEAKAKAIVLEMIGDLPDADVKPPENVLFVCKLNPITEEKDLKQIFSRFGPITSCDIIKDVKTDQSLQYGFIEFENRDDCEKAYFKMDNVLIDDRRIHVDFSQSVAKLKWEQYRKMRTAKAKNKNRKLDLDRGVNRSMHIDSLRDRDGHRERAEYKGKDCHRDREGHKYRDCHRDDHRDNDRDRDKRRYRDSHRDRDDRSRDGYNDRDGHKDSGGHKDRGGYKDRYGKGDCVGQRDRGGHKDRDGFRDESRHGDIYEHKDSSGNKDRVGHRGRSRHGERDEPKDEHRHGDRIRDKDGYRGKSRHGERDEPNGEQRHGDRIGDIDGQSDRDRKLHHSPSSHRNKRNDGTHSKIKKK